MKITGILEFISFLHPITFKVKDDVSTINDILFETLKTMHDKPCTMDYNMNHFKLYVDKKSNKILEYVNNHNGIGILLNNTNSFGFTNVGAYLPDELQRFNSRNVSLEITENSIEFSVDPNEDVFPLYYTENNSCSVSEENIKKVCKIGQGDECCIFLTVGPIGFACEKFNPPMSRHLLNRWKEGNMSAGRIGNCKLIGRKKIKD